MTIIIGIDPGKNGGLALIDEDTPSTRPMFALENTIAGFFFGVSSGCGPGTKLFAILEAQQAFPKQGVTSSFKTGDGYGFLRGVLTALSIPFEVVRPKAWQKVFGISGAKGNTKKQSIEICHRIFPGVSLLATPRCSKPHDGMSDALLIAEYGRRINGD